MEFRCLADGSLLVALRMISPCRPEVQDLYPTERMLGIHWQARQLTSATDPA